MAVKNISTRMKICGRSENCKGGHSAIEQSSYISRTTMYSEYDGQTYYPKYSEDLVHTEVMLPHNAPGEYSDPSVLWNAVEMAEQKNSRAQLARTYRVELPNEWSYELAVEVMRDYIKRNFVDEGMCAEFAIHDSENKKTHQRNLHCHILLTMRGMDEQGKWLPKQKKVYLTDENGERIPLMDKKTGLQKVDSQNRKQWKCTTIASNEWSSRENARRWRKDLADTINAVNERIGSTENHWEHRSFKEQGLDIIPQIHMGARACALERAGIRTEKGDVNRAIIRRNLLIAYCRQQVADMTAAVEALKNTKPVQTVAKAANEILLFIARVRENGDVFHLPVNNGKYIRQISNREKMQNPDAVQSFIISNHIDSFSSMKAYQQKTEKSLNKAYAGYRQREDKITHLKELTAAYSRYSNLKGVYDESRMKSGLSKVKFDMEHKTELDDFKKVRSGINSMLQDGERFSHKEWREKLTVLNRELAEMEQKIHDMTIGLAYVETIDYTAQYYGAHMDNADIKNSLQARLKNSKERASMNGQSNARQEDISAKKKRRTQQQDL